MRFTRFLLVTLILFLCFSQRDLIAQHKLEYKHILYLRSLNPKRLAIRLTNGVNSDSAKARIIHNWIASNISYDVKKSLTYNYSNIPIKRILRRRKAICYGYSQLFAELCNDAGLRCVVVTGYDKNVEQNQGNNFYFDEHAWNAVYIESGWKLVDVCWDAGDVIVTRRTFKGFFVYIFSNKKKDDRKYSPHFMRDTQDFYCLRSGKLFSTDHMPLNSIWQLHYPIETLQQYINDSSFYYKRYDFSPDSSDRFTGLEVSRTNYLYMNDTDKKIEDAAYGFSYNKNNSFQMSLGYINKAAKLLSQSNSYNNADVRHTYDSVVTLLSVSKAFCDTSVVMIKKQKDELTTYNETKKNTFARNNTSLIASTKNVSHTMTKGHSAALSFSKQLTNSLVARNKLLSTTLTSNIYNNQRIARKTGLADSGAYAVSIQMWSDSLKDGCKSIEAMYHSIDSTYLADQNNFAHFSGNINGIIQKEKIVNDIRTCYFDDLDYEVRLPEDSLIDEKYKNDSLLLTSKGFLFNILFAKLNQLQIKNAWIISAYNIQLEMLTALKSYCVISQPADKQYVKTVESLQSEFAVFNSEDQKYIDFLNGLSNDLLLLQKYNLWELKGYYTEKETEHIFSTIRKKYIVSHASALMRMVKNMQLDLSKASMLVKKTKKELSKTQKNT